MATPPVTTPPETALPSVFNCPDCEAAFSNRSGLSSHRRAAHNYVDKEAHARWESRKMVINARKTKGTGKFVCDKCGKRFKAPTGLGIHKRTAHGVVGQSVSAKYMRKQTGKFVCDVKGCGKSFQAPTALGYHKRVAHGIRGVWSAKHEKQKQARQAKNTAVVHVPTVSKRGTFVCPECGKGPYRFARALGKHLSAVHGIAGTSRSAVLKQGKKLKAAMQAGAAANPAGLVAPEHANPLANPLVCPQCGKGPFKSPSGLLIHQSTMQHQGGASFNGNGTSDTNEVAIAFHIGQAISDFKEICADHAHRVDLLPADFASRVMAVVQRSSKEIRARYRLSD